jgi:hypothetical protein
VHGGSDPTEDALGVAGPNVIGATAQANPSPCVTTITHWGAHCELAAGSEGLVAAVVRTTRDVDPERFFAVKKNGWAASCCPQPRSFASSTLAHSEAKSFSATPKPDAATVTILPSVSPVFGEIDTLGFVAMAGNVIAGGPQGHSVPTTRVLLGQVRTSL